MKRGSIMGSKIKPSFVAVLIILGILFSQTVFAENSVTSTSDKSVEYLKSVMDMIKEKYKGEVTDKQLIEGALKGMFGTMDDYTMYMTNSEADNFYNGLEGSFYGIGIIMEQRADGIMVGHVYPNSPAEKAGLISGDLIVSVNGKGLAGLTTQEASSLIKGPEGQKDLLGVKRGTGKGIIKLNAVVGKVNISPVEYEIVKDIAYIKLSSFSLNADSALAEVLNKVDKAKVEKIILDLRNNPGGYVDTAVAIANRFVPKGLITKLDYKDERLEDKEYLSNLENPKYKLAILVNGMSASASEILSGAVQDTKAGTLIGTKTFGKAKVQSLIPILTPEAFKKYEEQLGVKLIDAQELISKYGINPKEDEIMGETKITTGTYTTPKGRMIDLKGLTPDIVVADPVSGKDIDVSGIEKLRLVSKPGLNGISSDVYNAEKILKLLGYTVDKADSLLDKKTFEALKKFQKQKGEGAYGKLDFTTQKWLNEELDKLRKNSDKQYAKALEVLSK
jgi:carboxyl-terminal processing protease